MADFVYDQRKSRGKKRDDKYHNRDWSKVQQTKASNYSKYTNRTNKLNNRRNRRNARAIADGNVHRKNYSNVHDVLRKHSWGDDCHLAIVNPKYNEIPNDFCGICRFQFCDHWAARCAAMIILFGRRKDNLFSMLGNGVLKIIADMVFHTQICFVKSLSHIKQYEDRYG